ncbi:MAG: CBS domain-containing protein [Candidatus Paceibacterota bacterium]|jgi:CBS domain-containing protein
MSKFDFNKSAYVIDEEASIGEAMEKITLNKRGAVLVVKKDAVLMGIVSDGDIRRSLLKQATMITPISKILNMNVVSISKDEAVTERSQIIFSTKTVVNIIPIIDSENKVVDVVVRS